MHVKGESSSDKEVQAIPRTVFEVCLSTGRRALDQTRRSAGILGNGLHPGNPSSSLAFLQISL